MVELEAAKVSQGTVVDGATEITAIGALETLTGTCTGPPFTVAFRNTTLGLVVSVFWACNAAPANRIVRKERQETKRFKLDLR